jgi:hypothetical protein
VGEQKKKFAPKDRWFIVNLAAFMVLAVISTALFTQHFESYFTQVVLVGGVFTVWALIRLVWGLFLYGTDFEAQDFSRRLLASPGMTRLLILAAVFVAFLWFTTASLYFEFAGGAADKYDVQIVHADSSQDYGGPFRSTSQEPLNGVFRMLQFHPIPLRCQIIEPIGHEPADCSLERGRSLRLRVPMDFIPKEYHLLRLMPAPALFRRLPPVGQESRSAFDLEVVVLRDGMELARARRDDLRKQTLDLLPPDEEERSLVLRLADKAAHKDSVMTRFLADEIPVESAEQSASMLVLQTDAWPLVHVRKGDRLRITVSRANATGDPASNTLLPIDYEVNESQVQNVWINL